MRTKKFILLSILLVFLITSTSARIADIYVEVKNSTSPNNPISGAVVNISSVINGQLKSWKLTTDSNGVTPYIREDLSTAIDYFFDVNVTATGYQKKFVGNVRVDISLQQQVYKITTVSLDPISSGPCDNDGTCESSIGENYTNCGDCSSPSLDTGLVKDVLLVVPASGQTEVSCPEGYANKGAFYDVTLNKLHKLCVKYLDSYDSGEYVKTAYLKQRSSGSACNDNDAEIRWFPGGVSSPPGSTVSYTLCEGKQNIEQSEFATKQYVTDIIISDTGSCPGTYNLQSDTFYDHNNGAHKLCTRMENYQSAGSCTLSEKPTWMKSNPLEPPSNNNVVGWVGISSCGPDQVDYKTYNYRGGISNLIMYSNAPGCQAETLRFEIWEGPQSNPNSGSIVYTSTIDPNTHRSGNIAFLNWCPPWSQPTLGGPGPRYYNFRVSVQGTPSITSPFSDTLTVNEPQEAQCHFDKNSNADDAECDKVGKGLVCKEGNMCVTECSSNDDCEDGAYCDTTSGQCVECLETSTCVNSKGANYVCDLNADSSDYHKCVYSEPCKFTRLRWTDSSTNQEFDLNSPVKGWISNDYVCGKTVNLIAEAAGCKDISNVVFVMTEENFLIPDSENIVLKPQTRTSDSRFFIYTGFQPPWSLTLGSLLGTTNFKYRYYVSTEGDISKSLSKTSDNPSGLSAPLIVEKPTVAECKYDAKSEEDDKKCGAGKRCGECNNCINECTSDSDCGDGKYCASATTGGTPGRCYECFTDAACASKPGKIHCAAASSETPFTCVACNEASQCNQTNNEICIKNVCTKICQTDSDCTAYKKSLTDDEIKALNISQRIEQKGKEICDPTSHVCVQCNDNFKDEEPNAHCQIPGTCCWYQTACFIEQKTCVECIEDSICGWGRYCNKDRHICEGGLGQNAIGGGLLGGIILGLIGAIGGFMLMGPMGIVLGLLGFLIGAGQGGTLGGIMDIFSGGLGGLGGLFGFVTSLL